MVEQTRQFEGASREQGLNDLVDQLHRFDGPADQFLHYLLAVQCELVSAIGGAILVNKDGEVEVVSLQPRPQDGQRAPAWLAHAVSQAGPVLNEGKSLIHPLHDADALYGQRASRHVALVPLRGGGAVRGASAVAVDQSDPQKLEGIRERLEFVASLIALYEMRLTLQRRTRDLSRLQQSVEVLSQVNEQGRFKAAAMSLCNELAARFDAERVCIGFLKGRYVALQAMSHTEKFTRKMQLVQDIEAAMEECIDQDVEVIAPPPEGAMYVARDATKLINQHGPSVVCSLPLRQTFSKSRAILPTPKQDASTKEHDEEGPGEPFAVVTIERPPDKPFSLEDVELMRLLCDMVTPRLHELYYTDRWFGTKVAQDTRRGLGVLFGPRHTWMKLVAILVVAVVCGLIFIKGDYVVTANFTAEPIEQQIIAAPFEAKLAEVKVRTDDRVVAGQTVLAELDTWELKMELQALQNDHQRYSQDALNAMSQGKTDEMTQAELKTKQLEPQIALLEAKIARATLTSPISGKVIADNNLQKRKGDRVQKGEQLVIVAPLENLQASLLVPEDRIGEVYIGQKGRLASESHPDDVVRFTVERIEPVAAVEGQQNVFRVTAQLERQPDWMKAGMGGVAKVEVGERSWGYILTRDMVNWVRMKLWF